MRITNSMMTSRMLQNIQRNMSALSVLEEQLSSTKRIQVPSDDPILAARTLKFRTFVGETEQYQKNVDQGLSWMDSTANAFGKVNTILDAINSLVNNGATGTNLYDDRAAIATSMEEYVKQLGKEMNATYAGRYLFSGYRTDQPATYEAANTNSFTINQTFNQTNVENTKAMIKLVDPIYGNTNETHVTENVKIIKLAYSGSTPPTILSGGGGATIVPKTLADLDGKAYEPADGEINFIAETGELVLGKNAYDSIQTSELKLKYDKTNFVEGDLNPVVYFECEDLLTNKTYNMEGQTLEYEFGVNTRIGINSLAKNVYTEKMHGELKVFLQFVKDAGNKISSEEQLLNKYNTLNATATPPLTEAEIKTAIDEQMTREKQEVQASLLDRFNNMIGMTSNHLKTVAVEDTNLGTRMKRLETISTRLDEDFTNYKKLLSDNEDTNMVTASIEMNDLKMAYQVSLKVGAGIIQTSLADYIR